MFALLPTFICVLGPTVYAWCTSWSDQPCGKDWWSIKSWWKLLLYWSNMQGSHKA